MLLVQFLPNVRLPHSAALGQHHQLNVRPVMHLRNVLPTRVVHLRAQANGKAAGHLAHLAQADRGMPLQLAPGHALALKCTGSLNDAPP
jgi:hypothetical protein